MKLTAKEICNIIGGDLNGNPDVVVKSVSSIENSKKGDATFLADMRYKKYITNSKASLIIIPKIDIKTNATIIKVDRPIEKFTELIYLFSPQKKISKKISKKINSGKNIKLGENIFINDFATIEDNAIIEDDCIIHANVFIGENSRIGRNCVIGPNTTIYHNTEIGNNCIIHAGVVLGADGFGFIQKKNKTLKIPQLGKVIIKNNVEIGSNTTIDRGSLGNTIISDNVKLDNLIQIGHNVCIGENTMIAAQCGIAGSTKIGNNCLIGGQVAISDHITIGNNVKIAGKSGVIKNIPSNKIVQGPLAFDIKEFQKSYIHFKNLDKIVSELKNLKIK